MALRVPPGIVVEGNANFTPRHIQSDARVDTGHHGAVSAESTPKARHVDVPCSAGAEPESGQAPSVFESTPKKSTATASWGSPLAQRSSQSVYENQPSNSVAYAKSGVECVGSDSEYTTDGTE